MTDARIRAEVHDGATSAVSVMLRTRAGTDCGGCRPTITEVVAEEMVAGDLCPTAQVA